MSIISKIQSLITAANATTGESDATLTDAVQTLVDGYGQGGGGGWELIAEATTTEDVEAFRVDIPAAKRNMAAYLVKYDCTVLKGTASSNGIYHGPRLNSVFVGTPYISVTPTGAYYIGIAKGAAGYKMVVSKDTSPNKDAVASVEYVAMVGYYAGNLVAAGSTIKVYGIGEPT